MKKAIFVFTAISFFSLASSAFAINTRFFLKTGYMSWDEKVASVGNFVREKGLTVEPGVLVTFGDIIAVESAVSIKNTVAYSDAMALTFDSRIKGVRDHLGGKVEVLAVGNFRLGQVTLGPVVGTSGEIFYRFGANELWEIVNAKAGARFSFPVADSEVTIEGGATRSLYIKNEWDSSFSGNPHFTLRPKAITNPYAEISLGKGRQSIGIYYETWNMKKSPIVAAKGGATSGAVIYQGNAFQPDTRITNVGFLWSIKF
jgi:hypothetical protein